MHYFLLDSSASEVGVNILLESRNHSKQTTHKFKMNGV